MNKERSKKEKDTHKVRRSMQRSWRSEAHGHDVAIGRTASGGIYKPTADSSPMRLRGPFGVSGGRVPRQYVAKSRLHGPVLFLLRNQADHIPDDSTIDRVHRVVDDLIAQDLCFKPSRASGTIVLEVRVGDCHRPRRQQLVPFMRVANEEQTDAFGGVSFADLERSGGEGFHVKQKEVEREVIFLRITQCSQQRKCSGKW
jgi:hypothetical protein